MLHMLSQAQLAQILLPIGELTKTEVRQVAADLGLRTAAKPDSQDVCFITRSGGRQAFLGSRIALRSGQGGRHFRRPHRRSAGGRAGDPRPAEGARRARSRRHAGVGRVVAEPGCPRW